MGRATHGAGAPWADRPAARVDWLNFLVWTYGDIYTKISKKFFDDWGVPVDATISSFNDYPTKLMTMYAGGETVDVSQFSPFRSRIGPNSITLLGVGSGVRRRPPLSPARECFEALADLDCSRGIQLVYVHVLETHWMHVPIRPRFPAKKRLAATTVQFLEQCGDDLTRANLMQQGRKSSPFRVADVAARHHGQYQPDRFRADQAGPHGAVRRRTLPYVRSRLTAAIG